MARNAGRADADLSGELDNLRSFPLDNLGVQFGEFFLERNQYPHGGDGWLGILRHYIADPWTSSRFIQIFSDS